MNNKNAILGNFRVCFNNYQEYQDIVREIFLNNEYQFLSSTPSPFIIDCGSHIGLSILYFKMLYPQARIIAFEPNPENFTILQKNINNNKLENVQAFNVAVADFMGEAFLFGEFGNENSRSCGNSLISSWANPNGGKIKIQTVLLSSYIRHEIDYLKLDVEGVELEVLIEIENKIPWISELCIEYHGINDMQENILEKIISLLNKNNFSTIVQYKNISKYFPPELVNWANESKLGLATIHAKNNKKNLFQR